MLYDVILGLITFGVVSMVVAIVAIGIIDRWRIRKGITRTLGEQRADNDQAQARGERPRWR